MKELLAVMDTFGGRGVPMMCGLPKGCVSSQAREGGSQEGEGGTQKGAAVFLKVPEGSIGGQRHSLSYL